MDIISIHQEILLESSLFAIFSFKIPGVYQIVCALNTIEFDRSIIINN